MIRFVILSIVINSILVSCLDHKFHTHCPRQSQCAHCHCDRDCSMYGDCCFHAETRNQKTTDWQCTDEGLLLGKKSVYLKSKCRNGWTDQKTRGECENKLYNPLDDMNNVWMTSKDTSRTYLNYYCAFCNDDFKNLVSWDIVVKCPNFIATFTKDAQEYVKNNLIYREDTKEWGVWNKDKNDNRKFFACFLRKSPNADVEKINPRYCHQNLVSDCSSDWQDDNIRDMCHLYTGVVKVSRTFYKNPFCAFCNGISESQLECNDWSLAVKDDGVYITDFSTLLKVRDLSINGRCPKGYAYERKRNNCIRLTCLPWQTLINGKCQ